MTRRKLLSMAFFFITLVLSHYMCAVIAFNYCNMFYLAKYEGFSAPPDTAFLFSIPYLIGILVCLTIAILLRRKSRKPEYK